MDEQTRAPLSALHEWRVTGAPVRGQETPCGLGHTLLGFGGPLLDWKSGTHLVAPTHPLDLVCSVAKQNSCPSREGGP